MKRIFKFKTKAAFAMTVLAAVLALGVTPVTAEFDVAPGSVEFERISVNSEQMLVHAGFMDKTSYGWCQGWGCWRQRDCGQCVCIINDPWKRGECDG